MMGPSESTGKYVSPTRIRITENSKPANSGPCVGNVPADGGDGCLRADPPAIASTGHDQHEAADEDRERQRQLVASATSR